MISGYESVTKHPFGQFFTKCRNPSSGSFSVEYPLSSLPLTYLLDPETHGLPCWGTREPPMWPSRSYKCWPALASLHRVTGMPGLSHPKAQRLCLCPPMAEKRAFCFSFMFKKPTLPQRTRWERPQPGWPSWPQAGFHTATTLFEVAPNWNLPLAIRGSFVGRGGGWATLGKTCTVKEIGLSPQGSVTVEGHGGRRQPRDFGALCTLPLQSEVTLISVVCICIGKANIFITFSITYCMSFRCLLGGSVFYYKFGTIYYCLVFVLCLRNGHFFFFFYHG